MFRTLLFITLLLALQTACSQTHPITDLSVDTISVSGLGEVEAKSDQATLYLDISAEAKQMATAKSQADSHYQGLLDLLNKQNLSTDDLTLVQLNMNPVYEWRTLDGESKRYQTGYRVSRSLQFELNDLDKLPTLLEALANAAQIEINSIARGLQNPSAVIEEATAKAAADAKRRAEFIAKQFGRKLGEVKTVEAHHSSVPFAQERSGKVMMEMASASDRGPDEHLGSQKVSASLNVVFKLLNN